MTKSTVTDPRKLLTSGVLGTLDELLSDKSSWYDNVAVMIGKARPKTGDDASGTLERIAWRADLDDAFSRQVWSESDPGAESPPFDCRMGAKLWLSNVAGTGHPYRQIRSRADRVWPREEFGKFRTTDLTSDDANIVEEALEDLAQTLGRVWVDCEKTASLILLHGCGVTSMQISYVPETAFIGAMMLRGERWKLADALLHEFLHERTMLMRQLWPLMKGDYAEFESPTVFLPWSGGDVPERHFTAWRLLSAAHVYVHLAAYRRLKGLQDEAELPMFRSGFMLDSLMRANFAQQLGSAGKALVKQLQIAREGLL